MRELQAGAGIMPSRTQPLSGQVRFCQRSRGGEKAGSGRCRVSGISIATLGSPRELGLVASGPVSK